MKIFILNGPNLNLLGTREPGIYGSASLTELRNRLDRFVENAESSEKPEIIWYQSNHEGYLIDYIHENISENDWLVLNAGALTHTSIALKDAVSAKKLKMIEVHISNVYKREPFRHKSFLSSVAEGIVAGFGLESYILAVYYILNYKNQNS